MFKGRKGVSPAVVLALLITVISVAALIGYAYFLAVAPPVPVVAYTGEFDDAFLATKGPFYSDFSEQVDCNITSDVLGYNWETCIYRSRVAWNATASTAIDSRDWVLALGIDIDGPVKSMSIDIDTGAGTATTGKPVDDSSLAEVKLFTHEDNPIELYDFTGYIDDQEDLDASTGALAGDEYVLRVVWHTKSVSPAFTTGDDIARIELDLDTTEDADSAQITVESA